MKAEQIKAIMSFAKVIKEQFGDKELSGNDIFEIAQGVCSKSAQKHTCHFPKCEIEVPPAMWGCKKHWFKLPKHLRDRVWATYREGQEITKTPSAAYIAVAKQVEQWCLENPDAK